MAGGQNTAAIIEAIGQLAGTAQATAKPGVKTSEFWLTLAVTAAGLVPGLIPGPWGPLLSGVVSVAYTLARSFVKTSYNFPSLPASTPPVATPGGGQGAPIQ